MLTKEQIINRLEKNKKEIKSFGVRKLELFGSFARDEQKQNSDIDLLVYYKKERGGYQDMLDLLHFLQNLFHNRKIDLVKHELIKKELKEHILNGERIAAQI